MNLKAVKLSVAKAEVDRSCGLADLRIDGTSEIRNYGIKEVRKHGDTEPGIDG